MSQIDFLPDDYRRRRARRQGGPWRTIVVVSLLALMLSTTATQRHTAGRLEQRVQEIEPQRAAAATGLQELQKMQSQIAEMRAKAELITYLRHPWPRTQLIAALLRPMPDELTLKRLQIDAETIDLSSTNRSTMVPSNRDEENVDGLLPVARDLHYLRKQYDRQRTQIVITGVTSDVVALHRYMGELSDEPLFDKAELRSIEVEPNSRAKSHCFTAALRARAGYGQPDGPGEPGARLALSD